MEYALGSLPTGFYRQKTHGLAYGSGQSQQEARDKAFFEAVERFCSHFHGSEQFTTQPYDPATCVHPNDLMQFTDLQIANAGLDAFGEQVEIAWMWGEPLHGGYKGKWIPAAMVLLDYADEHQPNFALPTSSGCAAGPDLASATRSGVRELVERDAVALWWYRQALRPTVIPPRVEHGRTYEVLDVSTDFGLSVCVAISAREDGSDPVFGAGSGRDLGAAAQDAIRELTQVLTWRRYWQDASPYGYANVQDFQRGHTSATASDAAVSSLPNMYVVNLTRADVGLPVVRVVAPELLSHRLGMRNVRLSRVPERLGWRCNRVPDATDFVECPL
ncbi:hypothetical protein F183_A03810 [Bryobacterales bacterium F-183]|nr:hypothetical protein F183_A03810 [Bryobacterales bacterium F-183]